MRIYPLWPRGGEPSKRIIVQVTKGARAPLALLAGLVLHEADGSYAAAAKCRVARRGADPMTRDASKVPAVTLTFWIVKIAATTLGETAGDTVSMTMNLGYLVGTAIFLTALVVLVALQIAARKFIRSSTG